MIRLRLLGAACAALLLISGTAFADQVPAAFNFDALTPFAVMPSALTSNTVTATLSADGPFAVLPAFFYDFPFSGNAIGDQDFAPHALTIQFSEMRGGLSLDFALDPFGGILNQFNLEALRGGLTVYSASAIAAVPVGPFLIPQGNLSFTNVNFDTIRLTSSQSNFAIDNLVTANAPEPPAVSLLAVGLAIALYMRRRGVWRDGDPA
jgi:hypothetical protein